MSAATSPGTGLAYGLRRVCAAWGMARSSFYAMTSGQHAEQPSAKRRGPKPAISDFRRSLVAIEEDVHEAIASRLGAIANRSSDTSRPRASVCRDSRVARKRVLPACGAQSERLASSLPASTWNSGSDEAHRGVQVFIDEREGEHALADQNLDRVLEHRWRRAGR